jgi:hypothetical protein
MQHEAPAPEADRSREAWRSPLLAAVLGLLIYLVISGAVISPGPGASR